MTASTTRPPMANTSLQALAAAMAPKSAGSSTSGGKKSVVDTSATSSPTLVDGGVVERGQPDQQRGVGRAAASVADQLSEQRGAPLGGAPPARGPLGELQVGRYRQLSIHIWVTRMTPWLKPIDGEPSGRVPPSRPRTVLPAAIAHGWWRQPQVRQVGGLALLDGGPGLLAGVCPCCPLRVQRGVDLRILVAGHVQGRAPVALAPMNQT